MDTDQNHWVSRFFKDLCDELNRQTVLQEGEQLGFMDGDIYQGEDWPDRLAAALAHCKVFVALYSPHYFGSDICGKEWDAFASREVYPIDHRSHNRRIIPVLWVPIRTDRLPPVARTIHFDFKHSDFDPAYAERGLCALLRINRFHDAYQMVVLHIAERIREMVEQDTEQTTFPFGRREELLSRRSAFADATDTAPRRKRIRITVLACDSARLPAGRSPDVYGPTPLEWQPYRPHAVRPLAQIADQLVRKLGFESSVHAFEDEVNAKPDAAGLLLIDRWALLDPGRRALVKDFGARHPTWVGLMEPWNAEDTECQQANGELDRAAEEALRHWRYERKPSTRGGVRDLPTVERFLEELPWAAHEAVERFNERGRDPSPPGGRYDRPRLRSASGDPPAIGGPRAPQTSDPGPHGPGSMPSQQRNGPGGGTT